MAVHQLSEVDVVAISLVDKGANRRKFYLRKREDEEFDLPGPARIVKSEDWSTVYCVVAEPGWRENPGVGADTTLDDEWADGEEIRKAAHRFMKNGGLVNRMHETLEPYGQVVENFVSQSTFLVGEEMVKEGAWVVGIDPTEEGKLAIEKGEFTGISIQGTGLRTLLDKADGPGNEGPKAKKCPKCGGTVAFDKMVCPNCGYKFPNAVTKVPGPPGTDIARNQAAARGPLRHLIAYYMKKPHPFTACVRDNTKRFGPERANRVCATLKDLGTGTTKWRHGNKGITKAEDIPDALVNEWAVVFDREGLTGEDIDFIVSGLEKQEGTLAPVEDSENTGWLQAIGIKLGITKEDVEKIVDDEREGTEVSGASDERLSKIEETVTKSSAQVEALAQRIADIADKLAGNKQKDEEEAAKRPDSAEVYHRLDEVQKSLDEIHKDVDKLAEGNSSQREEDRHRSSVSKSDHPLAGLLSED
jgi:hypothetical protein